MNVLNMEDVVSGALTQVVLNPLSIRYYVISITVREAATMISEHVKGLAAEFTDAFT
jgi:hypothetical protein